MKNNLYRVSIHGRVPHNFLKKVFHGSALEKVLLHTLEPNSDLEIGYGQPVAVGIDDDDKMTTRYTLFYEFDINGKTDLSPTVLESAVAELNEIPGVDIYSAQARHIVDGVPKQWFDLLYRPHRPY